MWVATNKGMLSIVEHRDKPGLLLVRARAKHHLTQVLGPKLAMGISHTPEGDYAWRVQVKREVVAKLLADLALGINYDNFKDSVSEVPLHDMYLDWWGHSRRYQREYGN